MDLNDLLQDLVFAGMDSRFATIGTCLQTIESLVVRNREIGALSGCRILGFVPFYF